jgi:chemotaxis protein CheD
MDDDKSKIIDVPMAEMRASTNDHILRSSGIGSCVVITLFDPVKKVGALGHPMLAELTISDLPRASESSGEGDNHKSKIINQKSLRFIEPTIDAMITELTKIGGIKSRLEAKVVGGANMFKVFDKNPKSTGAHNAEAAKKKLEKEGIKIIANDTGGNVGRSVAFDLTTGLIEVKTKI